MSVNKVILLGNLGKDPELVPNSQNPICKFSLATSDRRRDANGNWADQTEWHSVVVYGQTAENCAKYLKKGRQIYLEGKIVTRKWQDKEGKDRYTTEIIAQSVQFIGSKGDNAGGASFGGGSSYGAQGFESQQASAPSFSAQRAPESPKGDDFIPFDDDDIPF